MLSSSELGLDKAGVVPLLKGHRVGPGRVGGGVLASWPVLQVQGADGCVPSVPG